jgi:hypothetical protein
MSMNALMVSNFAVGTQRAITSQPHMCVNVIVDGQEMGKIAPMSMNVSLGHIPVLKTPIVKITMEVTSATVTKDGRGNGLNLTEDARDVTPMKGALDTGNACEMVLVIVSRTLGETTALFVNQKNDAVVMGHVM